jgi:S1-C subfamily serine protease
MVACVVLLFIGIQASVTVRSLQPRTVSFRSPPAGSVDRIGAATVRIDGRGGGSFDIGTGVGVGAHAVLTNAHLTHGVFTFVTTCDAMTRAVNRAQRAQDGLDLAVVVTGGPDVVPVELAPNDPQPGQKVTIAGYPAGQRTIAEARIEGTLTRNGTPVLRFSPEPHPGQSGSPLIDDKGRLVAIAYAEDTVGGQGLAIPVSQIRAALDRWSSSGLQLAASGDPGSIDPPTCPA